MKDPASLEAENTSCRWSSSTYEWGGPGLDNNNLSQLKDLADAAMQQRGLEPDFPTAAQQEAAALMPVAVGPDPAMRDLRSLLWCSIDNDDSRDLDQLTVAQAG